MRFGLPRGIAPENQGVNLNRQRGNTWTNRGWGSDTHVNPIPNGKPNPLILTNYRDQYVRVFPDGPYDRTWEGVQKENPVADLSIGKQVIPSPLQSNRMRVSHINLTNHTSHSIGAGPALAAFNENQAQLAAAARPSLLSTIASKIRGS